MSDLQKKFASPATVEELLSRAQQIAGLSFADLANILQERIPDNLLYAKGWFGQMVEIFLGATAGIKSQPDFPHLGIELKTLPLNEDYTPRETTYVCRFPPLEATLGLTFEHSKVFEKLQCVLWVPIEANPKINLANRKIGSPFLWSPTESQYHALKNDFEEIIEIASLKGLGAVTAHVGQYLQARPKAKNSAIKCLAFDEFGNKIETNPKGFYLRTSFTKQVLQSFYGFSYLS